MSPRVAAGRRWGAARGNRQANGIPPGGAATGDAIRPDGLRLQHQLLGSGADSLSVRLPGAPQYYVQSIPDVL